ncbi:hypothetical protein AVEN_78348-1 [Araneus ventricosus]|uniref:Uncharacterized protein n=1 Tax=Araneus ventricosus TaxID=182803 RepID=A0A4Y2K6H9_ARAVE|nr:hypothetical protein AVEN_78348-1 [Araneus ventricosus]
MSTAMAVMPFPSVDLIVTVFNWKKIFYSPMEECQQTLSHRHQQFSLFDQSNTDDFWAYQLWSDFLSGIGGHSASISTNLSFEGN